MGPVHILIQSLLRGIDDLFVHRREKSSFFSLQLADSSIKLVELSDCWFLKVTKVAEHPRPLPAFLHKKGVIGRWEFQKRQILLYSDPLPPWQAYNIPLRWYWELNVLQLKNAHLKRPTWSKFRKNLNATEVLPRDLKKLWTWPGLLQCPPVACKV